MSIKTGVLLIIAICAACAFVAWLTLPQGYPVWRLILVVIVGSIVAFGVARFVK